MQFVVLVLSVSSTNKLHLAPFEIWSLPYLIIFTGINLFFAWFQIYTRHFLESDSSTDIWIKLSKQMNKTERIFFTVVFHE